AKKDKTRHQVRRGAAPRRAIARSRRAGQDAEMAGGSPPPQRPGATAFFVVFYWLTWPAGSSSKPRNMDEKCIAHSAATAAPARVAGLNFQSRTAMVAWLPYGLSLLSTDSTFTTPAASTRY